MTLECYRCEGSILECDCTCAGCGQHVAYCDCVSCTCGESDNQDLIGFGDKPEPCEEHSMRYSARKKRRQLRYRSIAKPV